ncbi:hypothetical protein EDD18DRAFT_1181137 [Armillaria luteobubalina]|uniref:Uncharacterized protein n=1 Tax=Armillaria luteobubalina TaxID=153913 RepID=A0AA39UUD1_9AGAR|nr:hypothetical protein EDD18DRAFT_1181137 [Armillaria luteobubalina]
MPLKKRTYIIIGIAVGATIGIILAPIVGPAILGFGAAGPVAGQTTATVQSGIGNVSGGSLFSRLQSMAMGGPIGPEILVYIIPGAAIGAIVGGLIGWLLNRILVDWSHRNSDRVAVKSKANNDSESAYEMGAEEK